MSKSTSRYPALSVDCGGSGVVRSGAAEYLAFLDTNGYPLSATDQVRTGERTPIRPSSAANHRPQVHSHSRRATKPRQRGRHQRRHERRPGPAIPRPQTGPRDQRRAANAAGPV